MTSITFLLESHLSIATKLLKLLNLKGPLISQLVHRGALVPAEVGPTLDPPTSNEDDWEVGEDMEGWNELGKDVSGFAHV